MTREEAIICKVYLNDLDKYRTCNEYKLLMQLLEQEPCEDCISRKQALRHRHIIHDDDGIGYSVVRVDEIIDLPSVTPSRPRGKWIGEESLDGSIRYMCDNCKEFEYVDYYDFCPNCGAKMEVQDANNS